MSMTPEERVITAKCVDVHGRTCVWHNGDYHIVCANHKVRVEEADIRAAITEAEADARAEERKSMECGHPQACFTLGEPGADIPFCSACKDVADERGLWVKKLRARAVVARILKCALLAEVLEGFADSGEQSPAESDEGQIPEGG